MFFFNVDNNEPLVSFWIGNFFEPAYSDKGFIEKALAEIKELGGNAINLDSKAWDDFYHFYETGEKSQYVEIQDFAIKHAGKLGMSHNFLAIYANGDNLYLHGIRDSPPRYGEQITDPEGKLIPTYKYWSPKVHQEMLTHVKGLLECFDGKCSKVSFKGKEKLLVQTMFVILPKPSFDDEGISRYHEWLKGKYNNNIAALNVAYKSSYSKFSDIPPGEYWFGIENFHWGDTSYPDGNDYMNDSPALCKFADNQLYRAQVAIDYFKVMQEHYHKHNPEIMTWHLIQQWQLYFSNGVKYWFFANMGNDPWLTAPHLDTQTFITLPADTDSKPDPFVVSCETAIMRSINNFEDFIGGLYLGRYVHNDIYKSVTPAQCIASLAAGGAKGLHIYGYNGLDDGGVIYRMHKSFKQNIKESLNWFKKTVPLLDNASRRKDIAMIFPAATMLFEAQYPGSVFSEHRLDLLGWFRAFSDLGLMIDFLHPTQVTTEKLSEYQAVAIPNDTCYRLNRSLKLENSVKDYLKSGGNVIHGYPCELIEFIADVKHEPQEILAFKYKGELIIPQGTGVCSWPGEPRGVYSPGSKTAIAMRKLGKGTTVSFGFPYGFAHTSKTMPVVPKRYGKQEVSPVILMDKPILADILEELDIKPLYPGIRGVEFAHFDNYSIAINHNTIPVELDLDMKNALWMLNINDKILLPHTAVCWET